MLDLLIVVAVIVLVVTNAMKRSSAMAKKKGGSDRNPPARPVNQPPWMQPSTTPEATRPSLFDSIYETIRDELEPETPSMEELSMSYEEAPLYGSIDGDMTMSVAQPIDLTRTELSPNIAPPRTDSQPVELEGLGISIDANALVKGVIFSEILNRKGKGVRR